MSKSTIKCDECGTEMYIDNTLGKLICPDCNAEKQIMQNSISSGDMQVESYGDPTEALAKADAYFDMAEYDRASEFYAKAINLDPKDYRGWWGITRCRMINNYLGIDNGYDVAFAKVQAYAPEDILAELSIKYGVYLEELNRRKTDQARLLKAKGEREITIKASAAPARPYTVDFIMIAVFACLGITTVILAVFLKDQAKIFAVLSVMLFLGAAFLLKHTFESKKIVKLIKAGECDTVSGLMKKLKRKNKLEFLKVLGSMITAKYLVDYKIVDSELIVKAEEEEDYVEEKIKKKKLADTMK